MKKTNKKIILSTVFLFLLYFILFNLFSGEKSKAAEEPSAETRTALLCQDWEEIETSEIAQKENRELMENTLEIPVGKSSDFMEKMANDLIEWSLQIIIASERELEDVPPVLESSSLCGTSGVCDSKCNLICNCSCKKCKSGYEKIQDPEEYCGGPNLILCCHKTIPGDCYCEGCLDKEEYDLGRGICASYCSGCSGVCCCTRGCENAPCSGNCGNASLGIEPPILDTFHPQGAIVDEYHNKIEDYFIDRFWPVLLYKQQFGLTFEEDSQSHIIERIEENINLNQTGWLEDAVNNMDWLYVESDVDLVSKGICTAISPARQAKYCAWPVEFYTYIGSEPLSLGSSEMVGYLDQTRIKMSECATEPYLSSAVGREEKGQKIFLPCQLLTSEKHLLRSFPEDVNLDELERIEERFQEGCYGNPFCLAKERENEKIHSIMKFPREPSSCAENFYCCRSN